MNLQICTSISISGSASARLELLFIGIGMNPRDISVQHYGVGGVVVVVVSLGGLCGGDLRFFVVCYGGNCGGTEKDECLGLVLISRLKVPGLSISYKNFRLGLIGFNFTQSRLGLALIWISSF